MTLLQDFEIARTIAKFISRQATPQEIRFLEEWKNRSEKNRALYERLTAPEHLKELEVAAHRYNKAAAWQKLESRIKQSRKKRPVRYLGMALGAAAALVLFLGIPSFFEEKIEISPTTDISPGSFKARLTLTDGSVVFIDGNNTGDILSESGVLLTDATLYYEEGIPDTDEPAYHLLEVPRGGECRLVLSDGTVVYMNSMSSLHYPARFTCEVREVTLSGEAFFEVAPSEVPFIVRSEKIEIRVHGTSFNVCCYDDSPTVATTLISGSVSARADSGSEILLRPAQQAVLNKADGTLTVAQVDPSLYTSWKEGQFRFRDNTLEEIMQTLSRWYDIEQVLYETEKIRDMRFGLNLNRYEHVLPILDLLNRTGGIQARAEGRRIVISH